MCSHYGDTTPARRGGQDGVADIDPLTRPLDSRIRVRARRPGRRAESATGPAGRGPAPVIDRVPRRKAHRTRPYDVANAVNSPRAAGPWEGVGTLPRYSRSSPQASVPRPKGWGLCRAIRGQVPRRRFHGRRVGTLPRFSRSSPQASVPRPKGGDFAALFAVKSPGVGSTAEGLGTLPRYSRSSPQASVPRPKGGDFPPLARPAARRQPAGGGGPNIQIVDGRETPSQKRPLYGPKSPRAIGAQERERSLVRWTPQTARAPREQAGLCRMVRAARRMRRAERLDRSSSARLVLTCCCRCG